MTHDPDDLTRSAYSDLLDERSNPASIAVVHDLDFHHRRVNPARWLPETFHDIDPAVKEKIDRQLTSPVTNVRNPLRGRVKPALAALCILLISSGIVLAASNILNLGTPTNTTSTNQYHPLGGFLRTSAALVPRGRPEVLFIGVSAPGYDSTSAEGWALVKALEQFGTLSGLKALPHQCLTPAPPPGQQPGPPSCGLPGYDFRHVRLRSSSISLVYRDLGQRTTCPIRQLSSLEWRIFLRYARPLVQTQNQFCKRLKTHLVETMVDFLPLLMVGNYVQPATDLIKSDDFQTFIPSSTPNATLGAVTTQALTFDQAQAALVTGRDPKGTTLVEDVNAETNIITALICHADGGKPAKACTRSVIRRILKLVK